MEERTTREKGLMKKKTQEQVSYQDLAVFGDCF